MKTADGFFLFVLFVVKKNEKIKILVADKFLCSASSGVFLCGENQLDKENKNKVSIPLCVCVCEKKLAGRIENRSISTH